jgi:hypothetical protein
MVPTLSIFSFVSRSLPGRLFMMPAGVRVLLFYPQARTSGNDNVIAQKHKPHIGACLVRATAVDCRDKIIRNLQATVIFFRYCTQTVSGCRAACSRRLTKG